MAQSQLFHPIAPNNNIIIWRNRAFLLTLRQNINDAIWNLLIDRKDKTISICEMKYAEGDYEITKAYASHVEQRLRTFRKVTGTKKSFSIVFVTPFGLYNNMYARKVNKQIIANDLFKKE